MQLKYLTSCIGMFMQDMYVYQAKYCSGLATKRYIAKHVVATSFFTTSRGCQGR